ncbi:MAG: VOC family protein [Saprospiraceae bacterium]|nr:VOC family protein [Saprospiraceae bacterium]
MDKPIISGIQQMGIGVTDVHEAWKWYRKHLEIDIKVFEEAATADLMLPYTAGTPKSRHAILTLSRAGGGGLEIWQHTDHTPTYPNFQPQLGDLGLFILKIKCRDINKAFAQFQKAGLELIGQPAADPAGKQHFFLKDPYGNILQLVPATEFFRKEPVNGGVYGSIIGVSDIEKARTVYSDILGYDEVVYDEPGIFDDLNGIPGGKNQVRRVLLRHSQARAGAFSRMLGPTEIELVQATTYQPKKIYEGRLWGDPGFIHLCFDIVGMDKMRALCAAKGHPFTIDSETARGGAFDMGEAAGNFSYIEDPDGTLIEFVETLKVPVAKKLGISVDLRKRDPKKPLPNWMLKAMALNRVK